MSAPGPGDQLGPIGIIDWGIGGLGLVAALHARGLRPPIRYLSDSGTLPYGRQEAADLAARVERVCRALARGGCSRVVVACNAASTVLDRVDAGIPVQGVLAEGVQAALEGPGVIGVVGGDRTITHAFHADALRAAGREVRAVSAQPWSALVERGVREGPEVEQAVARVLSRLGQVDRLLLACTHYPALGPVLRRRLPGVVLVDPIETVVDRLIAVRALPEAGGPGAGRIEAFTTGDPVASREAARGAWGLELSFSPCGIELDTLRTR